MTENNWFTTNLGERTLENSKDHQFEVFLKPYKFQKSSFKEAANTLAKRLSEEYDNLYLAYSGGMDSEFVLKTFHELGLPITPVILCSPFNELESNFAIKYCEDNNIKADIIDLDKKTFIQELYNRTYTKNYFSLVGGIPLYLADYVNSKGGKLITGFGDPFTITPTSGISHSIAYFGPTVEYSEWDYYLDEYDNSHPSAFFTYNIEVFYHLIKDMDHTVSVQEAKSRLYDVEYRPKIHMTDEFYTLFNELQKFQVGRYSSIVSEKALMTKLKQYIR